MTPEELQAIRERNQGDRDILLLIAEIEMMRSHIGYLEGYKEAVEESLKAGKPSTPQSSYTHRPNMPFFTRG